MTMRPKALALLLTVATGCAADPAPTQTVVPAIIVGGGPNALRLASCLTSAGISHLAFEQGSVGATIAEWFDGAATHSARDKLRIGGIEPTECSRCLDDVWNDQGCKLDGGRHVHCSRDEYLAYLRRVVEGEPDLNA